MLLLPATYRHNHASLALDGLALVRGQVGVLDNLPERVEVVVGDDLKARHVGAKLALAARVMVGMNVGGRRGAACTVVQ